MSKKNLSVPQVDGVTKSIVDRLHTISELFQEALLAQEGHASKRPAYNTRLSWACNDQQKQKNCGIAPRTAYSHKLHMAKIPEFVVLKWCSPGTQQGRR